MQQTRYTANVILPEMQRKIRAFGADLESRGYRVLVDAQARGIVVQGEADTEEDFLDALGDLLPDGSIIDDYGEAAVQS